MWDSTKIKGERVKEELVEVTGMKFLYEMFLRYVDEIFCFVFFSKEN